MENNNFDGYDFSNEESNNTSSLYSNEESNNTRSLYSNEESNNTRSLYRNEEFNQNHYGTPIVEEKPSLLKNKFVLKGFGFLAILVVIGFSNPFGFFDSKEIKEFKIKLANNEILNEKIDGLNKTLAFYKVNLETETKTLKKVKEDWTNTFKKVCGIQKQYNNISLDKTKECDDKEFEVYLNELTKNCKDLFKKDCSNKDKVLYIRSTSSESSVVETLEPSITEDKVSVSNDFSFDKLKKQIEINKSRPIVLNYVQGGKAYTLNMNPSQEEINSLKRDSKISVSGIEWHNTAVPIYTTEKDGLYDKSVKENFKDETGKYLSWGNSLLEIYENHKTRLSAPYIGYHFVVLTDGTVLNTRPIDLIASGDFCGRTAIKGKKGCRDTEGLSTGEYGNNFRFIQASFIGDGKPNEKQLDSMKQLSKLIAEKFSFKLTPFTVYSHNEFSSEKSTKENFLYWVKGEELTDEKTMISKALDVKREFIK